MPSEPDEARRGGRGPGASRAPAGRSGGRRGDRRGLPRLVPRDLRLPARPHGRPGPSAGSGTRSSPGTRRGSQSAGPEIVGLMVLGDGFIDQLYLHPDRWRQGIGSRLIALAKERRPGGLELYTFQENAARARLLRAPRLHGGLVRRRLRQRGGSAGRPLCVAAADVSAPDVWSPLARRAVRSRDIAGRDADRLVPDRRRGRAAAAPDPRCDGRPHDVPGGRATVRRHAMTCSRWIAAVEGPVPTHHRRPTTRSSGSTRTCDPHRRDRVHHRTPGRRGRALVRGPGRARRRAADDQPPPPRHLRERPGAPGTSFERPGRSPICVHSRPPATASSSCGRS